MFLYLWDSKRDVKRICLTQSPRQLCDRKVLHLLYPLGVEEPSPTVNSSTGMFSGEGRWGRDVTYGVKMEVAGMNKKKKSGTCPCAATRCMHPPSFPFSLDVMVRSSHFFFSLAVVWPLQSGVWSCFHFALTSSGPCRANMVLQLLSSWASTQHSWMCICSEHFCSITGKHEEWKVSHRPFSSFSCISYKRKSHPWMIYDIALLGDPRARFLSQCKTNRNDTQNPLKGLGLVEAGCGVDKGIMSRASPHTHKSLDFSTCDMDSSEKGSLTQIKNFHVFYPDKSR